MLFYSTKRRVLPKSVHLHEAWLSLSYHRCYISNHIIMHSGPGSNPINKLKGQPCPHDLVIYYTYIYICTCIYIYTYIIYHHCWWQYFSTPQETGKAVTVHCDGRIFEARSRMKIPRLSSCQTFDSAANVRLPPPEYHEGSSNGSVITRIKAMSGVLLQISMSADGVVKLNTKPRGHHPQVVDRITPDLVLSMLSHPINLVPEVWRQEVHALLGNRT